MQYNSWLYAIVFLGVSVLLYYAIPKKYRWLVLFAASTAFYLISCRQLILVLIAGAAVVYFGAILIENKKCRYKASKGELPKEDRKLAKARLKRQNGRILAVVCIIMFGVLFFTKYYNFAAGNINSLVEKLNGSFSISRLHLLMPLGISFYTLSAVSYIADVSRGTCSAQRSFPKLLLFLFFFPVITEGPISRYSQLGEQVAEGHDFDYRRFCFGAQLMLWGLFKKVVLADRLDGFVGNIFGDSSVLGGWAVLLGIIFYTFQIYMDFSGCVDIARGSAELFGITLEENFKRPFFAVSVNDFWRRWHITLGAWLRDYIFYPLSLSRPFQSLSKSSRKFMNNYYSATVPALIALLAVWFGNGIWHGAAWKYVCYGLYYYVIIALGMLLEPAFAASLGKLGIDRKGRGFHLFQIFRTFILVNIGMMIFRADNMKIAFSMFASLFKPFSSSQSFFGFLSSHGLPPEHALIIVIGAVIVFVVGFFQEKGIHIREWIAKKPLPVRWSVYIAAAAAVVVLGAYGPGFGAVDFIYAQF